MARSGLDPSPTLQHDSSPLQAKAPGQNFLHYVNVRADPSGLCPCAASFKFQEVRACGGKIIHASGLRKDMSFMSPPL